MAKTGKPESGKAPLLSRRKKELHKEGQEILLQIEKIKAQITLTRQNFDLATDDALIDSYIYELISLNKKYDYFLQQAKRTGLIADGFQKIG